MIEKFSIEAQKISVIPCAADMQFFNPDKFSTADKNILKLALGFEKDDIIICYQGSLGTWYMTNEMIACVKTMMHNIEKLKWLVLTNDMDVLLHHNDFKGEIKNKTKALSIARDEMPKYLSITDLGLFFILPSYSKQASSPTKLAELMAMEIPVISNGGVGDVDAIISEAQAGIILPELNEANYTFASKSINQLLSINKNRIRAYALKHFKHSDAAAVYSTIYQKINI
jgi:glycosyltransferase involved in cell wall biosynthesis